MKLFCDVETTGINPMSDEVITGYFALYDDNDKLLDEYELKSQVNTWSIEAEAIHKIREIDMKGFPKKGEAWNRFLAWIPRLNFTLFCYANPNTQLGTITFDKAIIQNEIMLHLEEYKLERIPFTPAVSNVYNLVRSSEKNGKFTAWINPETNRKSFSQPNVYKALFNETYNAHNEKDDVMAMKRIYDRLCYLNDIKSTNQKQGMLL